MKKTTWINPVAAYGVNSAYSLEVHRTSREYAVRLAAVSRKQTVKYRLSIYFVR